MPKLLVSVRSADEARAALLGGAHIIDVKEPARGPLGRADTDTWRAVRAVVPASVPVSVALGELVECETLAPPDKVVWAGIAWRKLGLSQLGDTHQAINRWQVLLERWSDGPPWIAVAYLDAERAGSPGCEAVVSAAIALGCAGVLFDTWDKLNCTDTIISANLSRFQTQARDAGLLVAVAGGLDAAAIERLRPFEPHIFAVRGAACVGGERMARIDADRVAALLRATTE